MIRRYAEIFCWKNVSSFCSAKATHIFSAKNIGIMYIESAKTVNEITLNELVKLTKLWTTGPWLCKLPNIFLIHPRFHQYPPYLQVSGWMSYADDRVKQRLFQQSRGVTLRLIIQLSQFSISLKITSMSPLYASFRQIRSKLNELCWWQRQSQAFSTIKGM